MTERTEPLAAGCAVVLVGTRLTEPVLPASALRLLRAAGAVFLAGDLPEETWLPLGVRPLPEDTDRLLDAAGVVPVVLIAADEAEPTAARLVKAGARVLRVIDPPGTRLLDAVAVMDRLRSPGGCPWDAEQTHQSLRQYLVEETYELLDAIEQGDRTAIREELGDVLLQVLFHARVAAEDEHDPFTVDEVAEGLVAKLVGRHPHVFADDAAVRDAATQEHRWEQLKQVEKQRESCVDGVALGQPAVALAAKLVQRASRAGLPADLLPASVGEADLGAALFHLAATAKLAGQDPEDELRAVANAFAANVRAAETAARRSGVDPAGMTAADWRRFWPR
ncbi:MazG family protein [Goodfellowiella coeruleoviolacea]|uniref:XTP/dITP diphosphohydrolase n=1 Tax=Goodfellowiella coeruleoviolacea TaxID=334858 RepID=A0AAE3GID7_9PSEU|nr:MazG family protein [Goodfellowiella coeruleoviolacea]MCP2168766.1 XTP/dITP diphosphohydrolase [Goodfellowiella coeruleoviolacea]